MKYILFIAVCMTSALCCPQGFDAANELYKNQSYDSAAVAYDKLLSDGFRSSDLYFNAGNAHFKVGNLGKSILYYERALKLDPTNTDARYNLDSMARVSTLDNLEATNSQGFSRITEKNVFSKHTNFWAYSSVILWVVGFALVIIAMMSKLKRLRRPFLLTGSIFSVFGLVFIVFAFMHRSHLESSDRGVVLSREAPVFTEPSENAEESFELHEGSTIEIVDENDSWYRIKAGQYEGWIQKDLLEVI